MTKNEQELLTIIRENKSPERALITAVLIIGRAVELFGQQQQQIVQSPLGDVLAERG